MYPIPTGNQLRQQGITQGGESMGLKCVINGLPEQRRDGGIKFAHHLWLRNDNPGFCKMLALDVAHCGCLASGNNTSSWRNFSCGSASASRKVIDRTNLAYRSAAESFRHTAFVECFGVVRWFRVVRRRDAVAPRKSIGSYLHGVIPGMMVVLSGRDGVSPSFPQRPEPLISPAITLGSRTSRKAVRVSDALEFALMPWETGQ
jgi:hypothetical protein